jgi:hypothetical protein
VFLEGVGGPAWTVKKSVVLYVQSYYSMPTPLTTLTLCQQTALCIPLSSPWLRTRSPSLGSLLFDSGLAHSSFPNRPIAVHPALATSLASYAVAALSAPGRQIPLRATQSQPHGSNI